MINGFMTKLFTARSGFKNQHSEVAIRSFRVTKTKPGDANQTPMFNNPDVTGVVFS